MAPGDFRSYGWTYVISGSAFVIGGLAMVLTAVASPMYLLALIVGPILIYRGVSMLMQVSLVAAAAGESSESAASELADSELPGAENEAPEPAPTPAQMAVLPQPPAVPEPAWLREAFSAQPLKPILPTLALPPAPAAQPAAQAKSPAPDLWGYALPCAFFLGVVVLVVFITPFLLHHWRISEARSEAEAIYLKRQAELKAELENVDELMALLDKQQQQVSLGFQAVARKVKPMVVSISNLTEKQKEPNPFARPVFDAQQDRKFWVVSDGTGFLAKPGCILTNHHVVKDAEYLRITFASGHAVFVPHTAIASDPLMDLAIVRMPPSDDVKLALDFADSDKDVHVGNLTLTVGSPFGLKQSVTHGIISAKGRLTNWLPVELLQTDAPVNPGNSGGPLLDLRGRVVGVTVAIATENGRNQGVAFAIPSNVAKKIFDRLVTDGEVPRGFMGVNLRPFDERLQELGKEDVGAVLIDNVLPNSPASKAGLKSGDVVVRFNNEPLVRENSYKHLQQMVASLEPGTEITLEVLRNTQRLRINVVLGNRPPNLR